MKRILTRLIQETSGYMLCGLVMVFFLVGNTNVFAADRQITGTIISSEDKNPLPGVTIIVKGNNAIGTSSDTEGKFKLTVPDDATLILSYIGYVTQEIAVGNQSSLSIELASDQNSFQKLS